MSRAPRRDNDRAIMFGNLVIYAGLILHFLDRHKTPVDGTVCPRGRFTETGIVYRWTRIVLLPTLAAAPFAPGFFDEHA
jgi:hypothetical protein